VNIEISFSISLPFYLFYFYFYFYFFSFVSLKQLKIWRVHLETIPNIEINKQTENVKMSLVYDYFTAINKWHISMLFASQVLTSALLSIEY
jgi:hypothetical protein